MNQRSFGERARRALSLILLLLLLTAPFGCNRGAGGALERAAEAWDAGDFEGAAREYEAYLLNDPSSEHAAKARFHLANIYYLNLRQFEPARLHYRAFLDQAPGHPEAGVARERLAEVLAEQGRAYEAIAEYENLAPGEARQRRRIRLKIAELYYDQKNYSQALTEYAKVTGGYEYDDLSEQAYQREASIYHLSRGQFAQAIAAYQRLASESGDAEVRRRALYGIADCQAGLFQFDEAIKTLNAIDDPAERPYIEKRIAELEQRKREASQAPTSM